VINKGNMDTELLKRITIIPGLKGGKPTIRGMRFPASDVLEMIASGMSISEILEQHPILEEKDIQACLLYASIKLNNTVIINAA
jgi:uncharacterized protein (DUF433 family)